jgi:polygalacturonase
VSVTSHHGPIQFARIRPLSYGIAPEVKGNTLTFTLTKPRDVSVEINGDIFHNLHVFTNPLETNRPDANDPNVIYLPPGFHTFTNGVLAVPSGKTLYLAGGAVINGKIRCQNARDVRILGRGIAYQGQRGVEVINSTNVTIDGLIVINPTHYTVYGGQSKNLTIKNLRAFSCKGWSDGIDLMSCSDVLVDGVFMRNSDDCIALYGHRWNFYGDATNIVVQNSTLWADVAHPILIGTHGDPEHPDTIANLVFTNIDILNHDEPQIAYQGCLSINVSDENLARDIRFENIRVEDFEQGQLINLRVTYNKKYAHAPGRGIENILFKDIIYTGSHANPSIISGYNETRAISNVVFENLIINGQTITDQNAVREAGRFHVGEHVEGLTFRKYPNSPPEMIPTTKAGLKGSE